MFITPIFEPEVAASGTTEVKCQFLIGGLAKLDKLADKLQVVPISRFCSYAKPKSFTRFVRNYLSSFGPPSRYLEQSATSPQNAEWFSAPDGLNTISTLRSYLESAENLLGMDEYVGDVIDELDELGERLQKANELQAKFRLAVQEQHSQHKVAIRW